MDNFHSEGEIIAKRKPERPYGILGFLLLLASPFIAIGLFFKNSYLLAKNEPKEFFARFGRFFKKLFLIITRPFVKFGITWKNRAIAFKKYPLGFLKGLGSLFVPGTGQAANKQYKKATIFFVVFLLVVLVELSTGKYFDPMTGFDTTNGPINFWRDRGGFFGQGLWGFFTLGEFIIGDRHGGGIVDNGFISPETPWLEADNSAFLLGNGVVSLVFFLVYLGFVVSSIKDSFKDHKLLAEGHTFKKETIKQYIARIWDEYFVYILVIPAAILLMLFTIVPFLFSFLIAFTDFETIVKFPKVLGNWNAFQTFSDVFGDTAMFDYFLGVLTWTLFYAIMASLTVFALGFIHALVINSAVVKRKKIWRILMILPWAIPGMISLMAFRQMFIGDNFGLANQFLNEYGMNEWFGNLMVKLGLMADTWKPGTPIGWFSIGNGGLAKLVIVMVNLWLGSPYFMMLIFGILGTIPLSLYEAASIDGATKGQKFSNITFPWVMKATTPILITTFTFNFNNFGAIYFLTGGGPSKTNIPDHLLGRTQIVPGDTDILISWIYKISFGGDSPEYNIAAVYSILIFIGISTIAIWSLARVKSFWEED